MSSTIINKILDKIRKLLRLAADPNNEHEAAAAAARAQELLFQHKLSLSDVQDASKTEEASKMGHQDTKFNSYRSIPQWKRKLAFGVARNNFTRAIIMRQGAIRFLGELTDVEVCAFLFDYLTKHLERIADTGWNYRLDQLRREHSHYESGRASITWKNSFFFGAVQVIENRLSKMRLQNLRESGDQGLILVKRSEAALERYQKLAVGKTRPARINISKFDQDVYFKGREAGEKVNLNRPLENRIQPVPRLK